MAQVPLLLVLVQVREPEPVQEQELVSAVEQLELVQVREPELVSAVEQLELAQVQVLELVLELELAQVWELAQRPGQAAALERARELRVSRQLELQQHRLPTVAQERLSYLLALPRKAPCWGAPAW